jgi:hypothetical protein
VHLGDALYEREEPVHNTFRAIPLGGKVEGTCRLTEDGGARLDDPEVARLLAGPLGAPIIITFVTG